jgi:hypothetical protein
MDNPSTNSPIKKKSKKQGNTSFCLDERLVSKGARHPDNLRQQPNTQQPPKNISPRPAPPSDSSRPIEGKGTILKGKEVILVDSDDEERPGVEIL